VLSLVVPLDAVALVGGVVGGKDAEAVLAPVPLPEGVVGGKEAALSPQAKPLAKV